jgi:hypothetical protein
MSIGWSCRSYKGQDGEGGLQVVVLGRCSRWVRGGPSDGRSAMSGMPQSMHMSAVLQDLRVMMVAVLLVFGLAFFAPTVRASYEWIGPSEGEFAGSGEGQLGFDADGVAINYGCYLIEKEIGHALSRSECESHDPYNGNVYVANGVNEDVLRFSEKGEKFLEMWGWNVATTPPGGIPSAGEFQTCGLGGLPLGTPTWSTCYKHPEGPPYIGDAVEGPGGFGVSEGIAVDQKTGDIYVLNRSRKTEVVEVFSADGEFIGSFGEGNSNEPVTKNPEVIHVPRGIAVDSSGDVYVVDGASGEERVMVFRPKTPGDFREYIYVEEMAKGDRPAHVAVDDLGNVYVSNSAGGYKFAAAEHSVPVCKFTLQKELEGMTVDPVTGEVFVYAHTGNEFHHFGPSCEENGRGEEVLPEVENFMGVVRENPVTKAVEKENGGFVETLGLAFDPGLVWESPPRPGGGLYALLPEVPFREGVVFAQEKIKRTPPEVGSVSVRNVGVGSAELVARVVPGGHDTRYVFQYGREDCFDSPGACSGEVPVPVEGDAGAGSVPVTVSASVSGLLPGTKYYFRVIVSSHCNAGEPSEVCSVDGPSGSPSGVFSTFGVGGLGDGRVFELVSPVLKDGGEVFPAVSFGVRCGECLPGTHNEHFPVQSAPGGGSVVYEGDPFFGVGGAVNENEYLSSRGVDGWGTSVLSPTLEFLHLPEGFKAFSNDLSRNVFFELSPALTSSTAPVNERAPEDYPDLYLQETADPEVMRPLVTVEDFEGRMPVRGVVGSGSNELRFGLDQEDTMAAGSPFSGANTGTGSVPALSHVIFEVNDALTTASVFAPEAAVPSATENNLYEWVDGGLRLVNVLPGNGVSEPGAVFGSGTLGGREPDYSNAISADGSHIFWTDLKTGQLYVREDGESTVEIPDPGRCPLSETIIKKSERTCFLTASADGSKILLSNGKIYNVNNLGEGPVDLTEGKGGFQSLVGGSEDLSSVYFVDTAKLEVEANREGKYPVEGQDNLYLWRNGVAKDSFVGTLEGPGVPGQVTPDGGFLAFMSQADLTGFDNEPAVPTDCAGKCSEVYEYDASSESLVCGSCNPTGERPVGPSSLRLPEPGAGVVARPANLANNGRLLFNSRDVLAAGVENTGFEDVYEYEPDGLGSCEHSGGCLFMISPGGQDTDSDFLSADEEANNVFFTTREQLVPEDQDDLIDLYDARVNGGFPSTVSATSCEGEGCKPPGSLGPVFGSLSSGTLSGLGNTNTLPPPPSPGSKQTSLTRAQKLTKALKACGKDRAKKKRIACETRAHKTYGTKTKTKKTKGKDKGKGKKSSVAGAGRDRS